MLSRFQIAPLGSIEERIMEKRTREIPAMLPTLLQAVLNLWLAFFFFVLQLPHNPKKIAEITIAKLVNIESQFKLETTSASKVNFAYRRRFNGKNTQLATVEIAVIVTLKLSSALKIEHHQLL